MSFVSFACRYLHVFRLRLKTFTLDCVLCSGSALGKFSHRHYAQLSVLRIMILGWVRNCSHRFLFQFSILLKLECFVCVHNVYRQEEQWKSKVQRRLMLCLRTRVPNLWPAGQKWPAKPQKVALDLLKNEKKICQKLTVLQDIDLLSLLK